MKFYHWTSKDNWIKIKDEWCLWWIRKYAPSRCTYLAIDKEEAEQYWDVVLEVEYDPYEHKDKNNYEEWCWQVRVYEPIPITQIFIL